MTSTTSDPLRYDNSRIARLDRLRTAAGRFPLSLIELGMRLAVGATFFRYGMNKLESFDTAITLFRDEYRLPLLPPELAAYMGTTVELSAPVLLVLGPFRPPGRGGTAHHDIGDPVPRLSGKLAGAPDVGFDPGLCPESRCGKLSIDRLIAFNLFGCK